MGKLYTCEYNLRPRVGGTAVLIEKGSPFKKDVIDDGTFNAFLESGAIKEYVEQADELSLAEDVLDVEAVVKDEPSEQDLKDAIRAKAEEQFGVKLKSRKLETLQAEYDELVAGNKAKGIFCLKVEDLADKELDELDCIHMQICTDNDLQAPEPFESVEQAVDKLTSEA